MPPPTPAFAAPPAAPLELWFSPTDDVTQHGTDFHNLFTHPELWKSAAGHTRVLSVAANYLLRTPPDIVHRELDQLRALHIGLDVSITVVGVDKKICGDGVEGMIWPGEAAVNARKLKALGVDVYSFSLDLPLSDGHILQKRQLANVCELSVHDVAVSVTKSVRELLAVYPSAKIIDTEVPTGIPLQQWTTTLESWLTEYKAVSGKDFDGFTMDAWWKFPWEPSVRATANILAEHGIPSGILIDESGAKNVSAAEWTGGARQHVCALRAAGIRLNYFVVADWSNMNVKALPETDPTTLAALVNWTAAPHC